MAIFAILVAIGPFFDISAAIYNQYRKCQRRLYGGKICSLPQELAHQRFQH